MNTEYYRNFVHIAELGTISAASQKVCIAQPALSNQLKGLEKSFGVTLFKRNPRGMELTEAGRVLYEKAKNILALEESAFREVDNIRMGTYGTLKLCCTQAYPDPFLDEMLHAFHQQYPNIQFELYEGSSDKIVEQLKSGIAEIGFMRSFGKLPAELKCHIAFGEHLVTICPTNNRWIANETGSIEIKRLEGVPLSISWGIKETIEEACYCEGFRPNLFSISTSRTSVLFWAVQGEAIAILSADSTTRYRTDMIFSRQLLGKGVSSARALVSVKGKQLSTAGEKFLAFSQKATANIR